MTNAYVRIYRNNKWENVEIDELTDKELDQFEANHPDDGWKWTKFLVKFIRNNKGVR